MSSSFLLSFIEGGNCELHETAFFEEGSGKTFRTVRGRTSGAFHGFGTFQWSFAVQAMALLMVRVKLCDMVKGECATRPLLLGEKGSAASSLDMSIGAHTVWLTDMFGTDCGGRPMSYRLFLRSNSYRKRPGPTMLSLNTRRLPPAKIEITINGKVASLDELISIESSLTLEFGEKDFFDRSTIYGSNSGAASGEIAA